jgi:hypothetical protein
LVSSSFADLIRLLRVVSRALATRSIDPVEYFCFQARIWIHIVTCVASKSIATRSIDPVGNTLALGLLRRFDSYCYFIRLFPKSIATRSIDPVGMLGFKLVPI